MPLYSLYVFFAPFEYLQERLPVGPAGLNYLNVSMVVMILAWLLSRLRVGPPFVTPSPLNLPLIAYLGFTYLGLLQTCISIPGASCPYPPDSDALQWYVRLANGVLFFWLGTTFLNTRRRVKQLFLVIALAVAFAFRAFYSDLEAVRTWHYSNNMRVGGPFVYLGSNEIAAYFAFMGVFLAVVAASMDRFWQRIVLWAATALCAYAVMYSFSRGAWLAAAIALVIVTVFRYRWLALAITVAVATSAFWLPVSVQDRFNMTTDEAGELETSAASRREFAELALSGFPESPLIGHGVGSFRLANPQALDTHNLYLRTLFEGGLVGTLILGAIGLGVLWTALSLWRYGEQTLDRSVGMGLFVAAVGLMVSNLFGDRFTHQALMAQIWTITGAAARLYSRQTHRERLADAPKPRPTATEVAAETA